MASCFLIIQVHVPLAWMELSSWMVDVSDMQVVKTRPIVSWD